MAKIGTFVLMTLVVTLVFAMYGSILTDMEQSYPDISINRSTWEGQYDYTSQINESAQGIKDAFARLNDGSTWLAPVDTTVALSTAIYNSITLVAQTIGFGVTAMTGILSNQLGLPGPIILILEIAFIVIVVFSIVSFWRRSPA